MTLNLFQMIKSFYDIFFLIVDIFILIIFSLFFRNLDVKFYPKILFDIYQVLFGPLV